MSRTGGEWQRQAVSRRTAASSSRCCLRATFATLAGLDAADDCDGNPACVPLDSKDAWPALTGATPPASFRTELLLGVGTLQLRGALRSGPYKLIAPSSQADGWSAQYPGTTEVIAPTNASGRCTEKPCLFDLEADPRETKDLADENPELTAKLYTRYKQLARSMYAPNGDEDEGLMALEAEEACASDDCWERRSHAAQLRRDAAAAAAAVAVGGAAGDCATVAQLTSGQWYLGHLDVFAFQKAAGGGADAIEMTVVKGCSGCKFTRGAGTLQAGTVHLIANGKGHNYRHTGVLSEDEDGQCRLHWGDNWADFCQGKACVGKGPAPPPPTQTAACRKMLTAGGFWQPYFDDKE